MDTHDRQASHPAYIRRMEHPNRVRGSGRTLILAAVFAVVALLVPLWVGGLASANPS